MGHVMRHTVYRRAAYLAAALCVTATVRATGTSITVRATDVIYAAGQKTPIGGGTLPPVLHLTDRAQCMAVRSVKGSLPCNTPEGCITLNPGNGDNLNDPDGAHAQVTQSSNFGVTSISGLTAPGAGYLVAVFTTQAPPAGPAPPQLNFVQSGTNFKRLSPLLNQVFFVGDGLTGDGKGAQQRINIPTGARRLYFGISDSCGYNSSPSCYSDNVGTYTVNVAVGPGVCAVPSTP
jgi:hypothetical protein